MSGQNKMLLISPYACLGDFPQLTAMVEFLTGRNWNVDLLVRTPAQVPEHLARSSMVRYLGDPWTWRPYGPYRVMPSSWFLPAWSWKHQRAEPYRFIVAVDTEGLFLAEKIAAARKTPVAYCSLEIRVKKDFPKTSDRLLDAHDREERLLPRCFSYIVQDDSRSALLANEFSLPRDRITLIPNAPLGQARKKRTSFWNERLGVPRDAKIVLYAGSVCEGMGLPDVLASVPSWPVGWVFVLHARYRSDMSSDKKYMIKMIKKIVDSKRVFISLGGADGQTLDDLVGGADVGVAFYEPVEGTWATMTNNQCMGWASGKLSMYLRSCLPVLVNRYINTSEWVESMNCGVSVENPEEIPSALERIGTQYEILSKNAGLTFDSRLCPESGLTAFLGKVEALP